MSDEEKMLIDAMYNNEGIKYDQATYEANLSTLIGALQENLFSAEYGEPDNLTATMMEMNLNRFGFDKSLAQVYRLNEELRVSSDYYDFRKRAAGVLELFNDHYLKTEYDTAIAVAQNASAWNRFKADAHNFPYLQFQAVDDDRTTAQCHALDGKYFEVNDPSWWSMYPPLHWNCRSEMIQVKSAPKESLLTGSDAMGLLGGNYRKMKDAGFASNRGETKDVFDLNKAYVTQLPGGRIDSSKLNWKDARLKSFSSVKGKPKLTAKPKTGDDVRTDFSSNSKNGLRVYQDKKGRKLGLHENDLNRYLGSDHTLPEENRQGSYFQISKVLESPDEVWFIQNSDTRFTYRYIKFFNGKSVVVEAEVTNNNAGGTQVNQVFNIKSFNTTLENKHGKSTDDQRNGVLIQSSVHGK